MVTHPLTQEVEKALERDERTADAAIQVTNEQGVITLRGYVESEEVRDAAGAIVEDVPDVVEVINDLSIQEEDDENAPFVVPPVPPTQP